jgi:hypothetical protein
MKIVTPGTKKRIVGVKYVYEIDYVYLNRVATVSTPFVSQVHAIECDKDGNLVEGASVELERVHNILTWPDGVKKTIAPGWIQRAEQILEVPIYETVDPSVTKPH